MMRGLRLMIAVIVLLPSCKQSGLKAYQRLEKRELATGIRKDSIFWEIKFGMTSKDFFGYCWAMNKKGLFTDGNNNTAVLHRMNHREFSDSVAMNFYPDFNEGRIYRMRVSYSFEAWAPWNKKLYADSLFPQVLNYYQKGYGGNDFIRIEDTARGIIYVKVDGNRRIIAGKPDDHDVKIDITDLLVEKSLEKK